MTNDVQAANDDICRAKQAIQKALVSSQNIILALNHPTLDPTVPHSYLGINIFDYFRPPEITTDVPNYICYEIRQGGISEQNPYMKDQYCLFTVHSKTEDLETSLGISRHDLLSLLIRDLFGYSNFMGSQLVEIRNTPLPVKSGYTGRLITFHAVIPNSLHRNVRTKRHEF